MKDSVLAKMANNGSTSPLHYIPAILISGFCLALLLFSPQASQWGKTWFYGIFLKAKGDLPPTHKVTLVSAEIEDGTLDRETIENLTKAILQMHPKILAVNLPASLPSESAVSNPIASKGGVVLAHGFRSFRPWKFSENAVKAYPPLLSRSLYPLLDGPGLGLDLPLGEGMEMSDSLLKWPSPTTGFSWPLNRKDVYAIPAFARLGRGVVASLGVEAARRALGTPIEKIRYIDGLGVLFDGGHILPLDAQGNMYLRFHAPGGIPRLPATQVLEGLVSSEEIQDKVIFMDVVQTGTRGIKTASGPLSATEIWAEAAAGILDNTNLTAPNWGGTLSVTVGLIFSGLVIFSLVMDIGTGMASILSFLLFALYPTVSFLAFMKSSWWLPPALPPLMIIVSFIPFFALRWLFPAIRISSLTIPPAPAFDPVLVAKPHGGSKPSYPGGINVTGVMAPSTPTRGIPISNPAAIQPAKPRPPVSKERQTAPLARNEQAPVVAQSYDPRDPPIIDDPSSESAPKLRPTQSVPVVPKASPPVQSGHDIERDFKGGLIKIGKYQIVRKMGFGSAGDVFEGFDTGMKRKVAIKTITKNALAHFDRAAERFELEAKAAGSLNHPNINTVYDNGSINEVSFMVLEYLDGITLSQWMRNHPTPPRPDFVAPWLEQISSAMDYAHSHKVIHRDLKPSNLMLVNHDATIKLLDFGIAKMENVGLTQTGMTVGTPSYMSPEQLSGLPVTPASDQYGLAVVIYQLLTYKLPYIGTKIPELCNRILRNDIVPINEVIPELGEYFWVSLRKALSKNPEERYGHCTEMFHALKATFPTTYQSQG